MLKCPDEKCGFVAEKHSVLVDHVGAEHKRVLCSTPLCSVSFGRKEDMLVHVKNVHEGRRYYCVGCGLGYSSSGNLNRHMQKNCRSSAAGDSPPSPKVIVLSNVVSTKDVTVAEDKKTNVSLPIEEELECLLPEMKEQATQTDGECYFYFIFCFARRFL